MDSAVNAIKIFPSASLGPAPTVLAIPQASPQSPQAMAPAIIIVRRPNSLFIAKRPTCTPMKPMHVFKMVYSNALVMPAMLRKYV